MVERTGIKPGGLISSGVKPCGVKWKPGGMISNGVKSGRSVRSVEVVKPIDVVKPRASVKPAVSVGAGVGDGSGISVGSGVGVGAGVGDGAGVGVDVVYMQFWKAWVREVVVSNASFRKVSIPDPSTIESSTRESMQQSPIMCS